MRFDSEPLRLVCCLFAMAKHRKLRRPARAQNRAVESDTGHQQLRQPSDRAMNLSAIVLFAAVLLVVYSRVADAPFVYDDEITIVSNSSLTRLWPLWGDA